MNQIEVKSLNINIPMLLLALLVILMFSAVGVAIAFRNFWAILLLLLLGFFLMGYGISLKQKTRKSDF